ncbi:hypothetical protein E4T56_gene2414, partial [Termitomyces sp. T112]
MNAPPPYGMAVQSVMVNNTPLSPAMASLSSAEHVVMEPLPPSLPSTVDETLARCPRFRILVVGNTGVGKSRLIANIFSIDQEHIDIADGRAGTADIDREYTSKDNPRFLLHDSKGFEPGITNHWGIVEKFIRQRSKKGLPVEQRLHALWYRYGNSDTSITHRYFTYRLCIEAPRSGLRLMQTADEELLKLAMNQKIPVIVVFTKLDLLYNEFFLKATRRQDQQNNPSIDHDKVVEEARGSLRASIEVFRQQFDHLKIRRFSWSSTYQPLNYVAVSTNQKFLGFLQTLEELTEVTRKCLHTEETFIPWAVAQRIDPKQKVQTSIEEGSKKYWKNLAKSTVFKGHVLKDCLWRIHMDIVKVWNFRDPEGLLAGKEFHMEMLKLNEPFMPQSQTPLDALKHLPVVAALAVIFGPIFPPLAIAFGAAGFTMVAINFLFSNYHAAPETALYLEAYIINLTLFLHELFVTALQIQWQRPLNNEVVMTTLEHFKEMKAQQIQQLIRDNAPSIR